MTGTVTQLSRSAATLTFGNLVVDTRRYRAIVNGEPVELTYLEFELLRLLANKPNRILSYKELKDVLWHDDASRVRRRLTVIVCRLRAKLGDLTPYRIQTVRGRGYGLVQQ